MNNNDKIKKPHGSSRARGLLTFPNESPGLLKVQCVRSFVEAQLAAGYFVH